MKYVEALIDKAAKICGSDAELAKRLNVSRAIVSMMRSGKRALSPEMAAVVADIAGEDARQAAIDAVIENARGTRRESVLREILGKGLAVGVTGMLVFSYSGDSKTDTEKIAASEQTVNRLYIVCIYLAAVFRAKRAGRLFLRKTGLWPYGLSQSQPQKKPLTVMSARRAADCYVRTSWL